MAMRRFLTKCLIVLQILAVALALTSPVAAQDSAKATLTVRLFVDTECPHSKRAWPRYRSAIEQLGGGVQFVVHHLPLANHPSAQVAAQAALIAREQGKELTFLDAVFAADHVDMASIAAAAQTAGLDVAALTKKLNDPAIVQAVATGRQAALAFGVRATPSALIGGRGLGGVPEREALLRTMRVAQQQIQLPSGQGVTDPERLGMLRELPEFVPAFDALRQGRQDARGRGVLGTLYRLPVLPADVQLGPQQAPVTVVALVDPALTWTTQEAAALQRWAQKRRDVRIVYKLMADGQLRDPSRTGGEALALLGATAAQAQQVGASTHHGIVQGLLAHNQPWSKDNVRAGLQAAGLDVQRLTQLATQPATTAWLHQTLETVVRVDGRAGRLYINGRVWWGRASDEGFDEAAQQAAAQWQARVDAGMPPDQAYNALIAQGKWRSDEELDLQDRQQLGDLSGLPSLGTRGPEVALLIDLHSFASRAAWVMLSRIARNPRLSLTLRVGVLPSKRKGATSAAASLVVAAARASKLIPAIDALLSASDPDQPALLQSLIKKLGIGLEKGPSGEDLEPMQAVLTRLRSQTDWGEEPVIFMDGRLYVGPLDEARLERALLWTQQHQSVAPRTVGGAVAQARPVLGTPTPWGLCSATPWGLGAVTEASR